MSFQTLQLVVTGMLIGIGALMVAFWLCFPAGVVLSVVQLARRRRRNWRDRWARQRTLEKAVSGVAASTAPQGPTLDAYPDPVEPDEGNAADGPPLDHYPDPT